MIQAVIKGFGGTIDTYFLGARPTSCTVSVFTGDGAVKVDAAAATVDLVNTTASATVAKGATTVTLASGSNVVTGRRYLLGTSNAAATAEVVTVKSLSSSVATLWAPTMQAHASGSTFAGTRVSYSVTSTQAAVLWWDGYARWTPNTGDIQEEVVDCVLRKIPEHLIDETDVRGVFSKAPQRLDAETDIPSALRDARDEFLRRLGGKNRAYCCVGADHFRHPCALVFWLQRAYDLGDEYAPLMERMEKELDVLIAKIESQIPFDNDQDGTTTGQSDGGYTVIRTQRA